MKADVELAKLRERLEGCKKMVREIAHEEGIPFDKDLFLQACKFAETLFVRSEISYQFGRTNK